MFTLPVVAVLDSFQNKRNLNITLSSYHASVACRFFPPTSDSQKINIIFVAEPPTMTHSVFLDGWMDGWEEEELTDLGCFTDGVVF